QMIEEALARKIGQDRRGRPNKDVLKRALTP
ncbi:MAG: hypothetical protein ACJAS1_005468, partial [Oleiphilaceae bacterium]